MTSITSRRAWILFGSRKNPKPACPGRQAKEKCSKKAAESPVACPDALPGSSAPKKMAGHHFSRKDTCVS
jgi:hypothetical protein